MFKRTEVEHRVKDTILISKPTQGNCAVSAVTSGPTHYDAVIETQLLPPSGSLELHRTVKSAALFTVLASKPNVCTTHLSEHHPQPSAA